MRYTVVWDDLAEAALANLWTGAIDQQAIADAADTIDRLLRARPEAQGQPDNGYRRLVVKPLEVVFTVSPDDLLVCVTQVRRSN
jgi:hypothetical protein